MQKLTTLNVCRHPMHGTQPTSIRFQKENGWCIRQGENAKGCWMPNLTNSIEDWNRKCRRALAEMPLARAELLDMLVHSLDGWEKAFEAYRLTLKPVAFLDTLADGIAIMENGATAKRVDAWIANAESLLQAHGIKPAKLHAPEPTPDWAKDLRAIEATLAPLNPPFASIMPETARKGQEEHFPGQIQPIQPIAQSPSEALGQESPQNPVTIVIDFGREIDPREVQGLMDAIKDRDATRAWGFVCILIR